MTHHPLRGRRVAIAIASLAACVPLALTATFASASTPAAGRATPEAGGAKPQATCPWLNESLPVATRVHMVLSAMTLPDKITMVEGQGTSQPYVFYMAAQPSLCIPAMGLEDGPNGVGDGLTGVTQLPAGVSLAATFDPSLANQYGKVIGSEEWGKGASVNLGPTVNIDRDPRWGRSFETFTEDPYLNASLAVSEIDGVQSTGEMSQVKHFDVYNQETNRNTPQDDVIISRRALHEIYLPAFEQAVKKAKVASVMCAYSTINGNYACQNPYLETKTLDQRWGFKGFVTSDYGAIHSTSAALDGTDMEQPFSTYFGSALETEVQNGTVPVSVLNGMVSRILTEMFRFGLFNHPPTGTTSAIVTTPAHQAVSLKVAEA
ncbi:MAG TPA: glycoside hydrolase family 3 N-terminal domain-containing protein, partial [Streptosporangiaceae bacterium]|nr:glycoside hydrolase family 3 N-terminal domain-containing protein [Streptosporangiaceae bacterium]